MDADGLADIMVNTELLRDGANLLMHDREWTADALEKIVLGLRQKGYEFVDPSTI
jgi:peptidoglycan/xylan/chitin deacetylase (PgdA/CDA1 family)